MTTSEISNVTRLIKDIRNKLNEIERLMGKSPKGKFTYPVNNQLPSLRKRNPYRNLDNNSGKA